MDWKDKFKLTLNQYEFDKDNYEYGQDLITIPIDTLIRTIDINLLMPLKSELWSKIQLLQDIEIKLRNGGYDDNSEYGKLYIKINDVLNEKS